MENNPHVHPTAIIHPKAVLGAGTRVGAFSSIGEGVVLGERCEIQENVVLRGPTQIGNETKIFPGAVIGGAPQHLQYKGEPTTLSIGNRVTLRECVTVSRGTAFGNGTTTIGDDVYLMAYTHVAHDCAVGRGTIIANGVQMAGHVTVEDYVTIGGASAIAQFCRVGRYCYIGGGSSIRKDIPPFLIGKGHDFEVQGVNVVGLTRHGFSSPTLTRLKAIYKIFYLQHLTVGQAIEKIAIEVGNTDEAKVFIDFVKGTKLGFLR
jgi:UDP-N-acetylglucosamine acyltransferase